MASNFEPNTLGYVLSILAGGACGLLPYTLARKRSMKTIGVLCIFACAAAGLKGGIIFALPIAGLLSAFLYPVRPDFSRETSTWRKYILRAIEWGGTAVFLLIVIFTLLDFMNRVEDIDDLQTQLNAMLPNEREFCLDVLGQIDALSTERDVLALLGDPSRSLKLKKNWWVNIDGKKDRIGVYFDLQGYATQVIFDGGFNRFYYSRNIEKETEFVEQDNNKEIPLKE